MELKYVLRGDLSSRRIILRREYEAGIIQTSIRTEYQAYQAFAKTDVPVPKVIWTEEDPSWLKTPFYVMEEILDCQALRLLFSAPPYNAVRERIGETFCRIMSTIAA